MPPPSGRKPPASGPTHASVRPARRALATPRPPVACERMTVAGDHDLALAALAGDHPIAFFGTLTELIELAGAATIAHDDLHVHGTVIPAVKQEATSGRSGR